MTHTIIMIKIYVFKFPKKIKKLYVFKLLKKQLKRNG